MELPDPDAVAADIKSAIEAWNATTERGQYSRDHKLGISDIGHCREYARRMIIQSEFTDEPDKYLAFLGTWIGAGVEEAVKKIWPEVKVGMAVNTTLPSGIVTPGHPDLVLPNGVLDIKTVDGLTTVRRQGASVQQRFQRNLYAAGLIQAGELPEDCFVGNVWFDRSGRDKMPFVEIEPYDSSWLMWADEWLDDVHYAVINGEEAMKDKPIEFCQVACEFYSVCRAPEILSDREGGGLLTEANTLDLIDAYLEAKDAKKQAELIMDDVRRGLAGISGRTGSHIVKWVEVGESDVPGYRRAGYTRLDIRKLPKA